MCKQTRTLMSVLHCSSAGHILTRKSTRTSQLSAPLTPDKQKACTSKCTTADDEDDGLLELPSGHILTRSIKPCLKKASTCGSRGASASTGLHSMQSRPVSQPGHAMSGKIKHVSSDTCGEWCRHHAWGGRDEIWLCPPCTQRHWLAELLVYFACGWTACMLVCG